MVWATVTCPTDFNIDPDLIRVIAERFFGQPIAKIEALDYVQPATTMFRLYIIDDIPKVAPAPPLPQVTNDSLVSLRTDGLLLKGQRDPRGDFLYQPLQVPQDQLDQFVHLNFNNTAQWELLSDDLLIWWALEDLRTTGDFPPSLLLKVWNGLCLVPSGVRDSDLVEVLWNRLERGQRKGLVGLTGFSRRLVREVSEMGFVQVYLNDPLRPLVVKPTFDPPGTLRGWLINLREQIINDTYPESANLMPLKITEGKISREGSEIIVTMDDGTTRSLGQVIGSGEVDLGEIEERWRQGDFLGSWGRAYYRAGHGLTQIA